MKQLGLDYEQLTCMQIYKDFIGNFLDQLFLEFINSKGHTNFKIIQNKIIPIQGNEVTLFTRCKK